MTRKHYTALAATLGDTLKFARENYGENGATGATLIIHDICDALREENPRFDRQRFIDAVRAASHEEATA